MSRSITVLTGAGISADSGLDTFRDTDGLWQQYDLKELATPQAWEKHPQKVLDFYNFRRRQTAEAEPNKAHEALTLLEKDFDVVIITQNIDDLHERAGSSEVWHLHGKITEACSDLDHSLVVDIGYDDINLGDTAPDGGQLRPNVVWFGEAVPMMESAVERVRNTDLLIIVGTSLQVYPAAGLAELASAESEKFIIDPSDVVLPAASEWNHYKETAVRGTPRLVKHLMGKR